METLSNQLSAITKGLEGRDGLQFGKIAITARPIRGVKVGYAGGYKRGGKVQGYIVIDNRFVEYCKDGHPEELTEVIAHELGHLIAENVKKNDKRSWHGDGWKEACKLAGGNGQRYYSGGFTKPENKGKTFKTKAELRTVKPTQPADTWERGTFRQWLERGYHVIKGQHGEFVQWDFKDDAYEDPLVDGKQRNGWGRACAVYFTPDQVEANA